MSNLTNCELNISNFSIESECPLLVAKGEPIKDKELLYKMMLITTNFLELDFNKAYLSNQIFNTLNLPLPYNLKSHSKIRNDDIETQISLYQKWNSTLKDFHQQLLNKKLDEPIYLKNLTNNQFYINSERENRYGGWLNWDGSIFTDNYCLKEWPKVEGIYGETLILSYLFPNLSMDIKLYENKGLSSLCLHISINKGKVKVNELTHKKNYIQNKRTQSSVVQSLSQQYIPWDWEMLKKFAKK